jgi:hypothetical protein
MLIYLRVYPFKYWWYPYVQAALIVNISESYTYEICMIIFLNRIKKFLWDTDWIRKYYLDELQLQAVK